MSFNALFAALLILCIFACQKNSDTITPNPAETNAFVPPTSSDRRSNIISDPQITMGQKAIIVARRTDTYIEPQYQQLFNRNSTWKAICIDIDWEGGTIGNFFGLTIVPPASAMSFTYIYNPINCASLATSRVTNELSKTTPPDPSCTTSCWLGKVLAFFSN